MALVPSPVAGESPKPSGVKQRALYQASVGPGSDGLWGHSSRSLVFGASAGKTGRAGPTGGRVLGPSRGFSGFLGNMKY